ncbi:MAG TPA: SRPBCC family protein, partial [Asanoa sp.]|nr:SRPBCC family protein [Asanoa sp.]
MTDTYTVSRSIDIAAPPARIYPKIADFHNWTQWSPWEDMDPDIKREYSGAESGLGAAYAWSGNTKAGKGRMEIV